MSVFKDKVLLITGGTGSFGNAVLRRFLDSDIKEIRIFSRDEKKQDDMRHALQNPKSLKIGQNIKFDILVVRK
jgi:UDP-N-acetylglucosamine 4,6-dehydratase